jgi:hypothetical protein
MSKMKRFHIENMALGGDVGCIGTDVTLVGSPSLLEKESLRRV